jgi:hypothetical protein
MGILCSDQSRNIEEAGTVRTIFRSGIQSTGCDCQCLPEEGLPVPAYAPIDMSIAMENIWLETDSLGLGGVWIGTYPMQERMDAVRKILNIPDSLEVFALFPFGYPAESRPQQDRTDPFAVFTMYVRKKRTLFFLLCLKLSRIGCVVLERGVSMYYLVIGFN